MDKNNENLKKFGKKIIRLRLEQGIDSQIDLANRSGLDRTYIGGIERGERNISIKNIIKIAKALGVHPSELLKF
jgi:transcriptional regulator with XRE-family HTH domain